MTTTQLIALLTRLEHGASGRSREVSLSLRYKNGSTRFIPDPEIMFHSSGDGVAGAELTLLVVPREQV